MGAGTNKYGSAILDKKPINSCMERSKKEHERMRSLYGPSNTEILQHIVSLEDQIKVLSEKIDKCLKNL